jgi:hypothetical protein
MAEARDLETGASEHPGEEDLVGWLGVPPDHEQQPGVVLCGELDRRVGAKRGDQQPLALAAP